MADENIRSIDEVGRYIHEYYRDLTVSLTAYSEVYHGLHQGNI